LCTGSYSSSICLFPPVKIGEDLTNMYNTDITVYSQYNIIQSNTIQYKNALKIPKYRFRHTHS